MNIDFENGGANVLDRISEMYGFTTKLALAKHLNISAASLAQRYKRDILPADIVVRCMAETGASLEWLTTGKGEMLSSDKRRDDNSFSIDYLDVTASAGNGFYSSDAKAVVKVIDYDLNEAKLLFGHLKQEHLKIINIAGDSMQPTFESGDLIFVDVSRKVFEGDGIYVFTFGRGLYVKRLQLIKNTIKVISDNETYSDWEIVEAEFDQLFIHGKVMLSQSSLLRKHG